MAQALVKNNAYSTLAAGISSSVTTITVAVGHGARFPTVSGGNFFYATLINASNVLEIVKVVGRSGDILTVTRGQDGTTGTAYLLGDRIELRPTAGLFDDKLSLGGGTLTGPLSVPAGAATTQVPQVQEVVKRAGDTMTGPLITPELTVGILKGSSGLADIPTGHRILAADVGAIVAPGMSIQHVYTRSDTVTTYTVTAPAGNGVTGAYVAVAALDTIITPKFATSKILIDISVSGDLNSTDVIFSLERNGTIIGRNAAGSERWYGMSNTGYNAVGSQPETWRMLYLDSPATVAAVTYKLLVQHSRAGALSLTFYLNRAAGAVPQSQYESGISQMLLQEIAQ